MTSRRRVVQVGVGSLGVRLAGALAEARDLDLAGAFDHADAVVGREVAGRKVESLDLETIVRRDPEVVVLATSSRVEEVVPQAAAIARRGLAVVSTCEDLAWPFEGFQAAATVLHEAGRAGGVPILATGVNPGFLMDYLPLVLSGLSRDLRRVEVRRVLDASLRRPAFQAKVGVGLDRQTFDRRVAAGGFGHAGLRASASMLARGLGLEVERIEETFAPVLGAAAGPGEVLGVEQTCSVLEGGEVRIRLHFRAAAGETDPHDAVLLEGTPPVRMRIEGGTDGDEATVSVVLHAVRAALAGDLEPGLRTMLDLAPIRSRMRR